MWSTERPGPASVVPVRVLLAELEGVLGGAGIVLARDEARDIVAATLDVSRFWPVLHGDDGVDAEAAARARAAAARRASGAPFAYAVGRAAFRHLTLRVDERVLIPRQETEELVDLVLDEAPRGVAVDLGTGSGAIALALASEGSYTRIVATDVSADALAVARLNAAECGGPPIEFRLGSYFAPLGDVTAHVIAANLPYISYEEAASLPAGVRDWEPAVALFSAETGMTAIRTVIRQAAPRLAPGGLLALELDSRRASLAAEMAASDGRYRNIGVRLDLSGRERFLLATRGGA